jgi:hypothetical protein
MCFKLLNYFWKLRGKGLETYSDTVHCLAIIFPLIYVKNLLVFKFIVAYLSNNMNLFHVKSSTKLLKLLIFTKKIKLLVMVQSLLFPPGRLEVPTTA